MAPKTKSVDRSAISGRFVRHDIVVRHPDTTVTQRVPVKSPKRQK